MPTATQPQRSDKDLVRRAQRGDRAAMVALYQRYVDEMLGYAYNQLGSLQDAEDLTSETFLRLVRAIGSFDGRSSFRTWLYTIMRNQLRDHWRRNGRKPTVLLEDHGAAKAALNGAEGSAERLVTIAPAGPPETEDDAPASTATRLGRAVLEQLPDNYRTVLRHRILDGRSIRDTAAEMGIREGNVKVMQHRALRRAAQIAEQIEDEEG